MEKQIKKRFKDEGFGKEAIILCLDGTPSLGHAITTLEQASDSESDNNRHRTRWAANYVDNFLVSQVTSRLSTYHVFNLCRYLGKLEINLPKTRQRLKEFRNECDTEEGAGFFNQVVSHECKIQGGYLYPYSERRYGKKIK